MTNILVPTDFTPASLKFAEGALKNVSVEKCNIVLYHAFAMPSSPFDLLGGSLHDPSCELITESFRQACKQLKDDHTKMVNKIIVRSMIGNTKALFRNFIEANDIDLIYCPEEFYFKPVHSRSVNPLSLFKKCGIPVLKDGNRKTASIFNAPYFNTIPVTAQ